MLARRLTLLTGALVATAATALALVTPIAAAGPAPAAPDPVTAALDVPPPGSNDFSCRPSAEHPEPVVLAHGLTANQFNNWKYLSPILKREGYCVFSLTYGRSPLAPPPLSQVGGLTEIERSAREFQAFVDRVLAATGAAQIDVLGHSEGSIMPNQYVRFLDGAKKVKRYVGVTPVWNGSNVLGLAQIDQLGRGYGLDGAYSPAVASLCAACRQLLTGSEFLARMASDGGPAEEGIDYTMILTNRDQVVVPFTSGLLDGAENIVLQDVCPTDNAGHVGAIFSPNTAQIVLNALDPDRDEPVRCSTRPSLPL